MTLVDLVKKLKAIQEAHPMIRTFGEGDIYDYVDNGGEIQYPVLWTTETAIEKIKEHFGVEE